MNGITYTVSYIIIIIIITDPYNNCVLPFCMCQDLDAGFFCNCADGWTGTTCDQDIQDCFADTCDRGTCHVSFPEMFRTAAGIS